jgi:hypothetical protein
MVEYVRTYYSDISACLRLGGKLTDPIPIRR